MYNSQIIENSFVKRTYTDEQISSAKAAYFEPTDLSVRKFKPIHHDEKKLIGKISELIHPLQIKKYEIKNVMRLQSGTIKNFQVVQYEVNDGSVWKTYFTNRQRIASNERQGSAFTDAQVQVYTDGPKESELTSVILKGLQTDPTISNKSVFVDSEAVQKITLLSADMKFDPKDERFDQIQVFYYLNHIQDWMKINLSVRFAERLHAVVGVGYPEKTNTAFYFENKIRLGRGDDIDYAMLAADPSIVYHESFHGLIDGLARLPFEGEGGSLNEGFADFFTCAALNRPFVGESAYLKAPYKRTIQSAMTLAEKTGGLYHDSQIISSLLWEIRTKLGNAKSLKIAADTLVELNPNSDFTDFNNQLLKVTKTNQSSSDLLSVRRILSTRGFKSE